jgi:hypothetical protein
LVIKAVNSSSMIGCQFDSTTATWMEKGTGDKADAKVADKVSMSAGRRKPCFTHVVIG